ncbi:amino acid/amide ABC transporter ATP-binding protein 1, HAAT family (TC 3.A.1.4.-) [Geosporobacter subterraneus DSM 17957]|uniref:Amino acid/amide ABC transporter ATP-binding protein 1, HAAT family (TC 3.A.1.4.-) n=1 Tax=Geosporobacter subterraneus DSM 17957 TaxID=1121919 RepID=A0A1M6F7Y8_9FIRM|nr:ABC transporter ATP-binding protein [Geosporobacter subterraneus]SHI93800.1 amino acid/amide ABC transporter ATP-binding protein 1, HAAT family (TC 3.A.1.4.-) [Geosporobacter subterraneus DSM 17957]
MDKKKILSVENLSIAFGGLKAVDNLSFSINEREIYGLIGPNGAGKTTVFNCITQFYRPNEGQVLFTKKDGEVLDLVGKKTHDIIKLGLVRTFQNVELIQELSLIDNLLIGAHIEFKTGIISQALRLRSAVKEETELRAKALGILEFLELKDKKDELASGQPYGVLKKIELGRTLMGHPKLIILDEPAAGLNDTETNKLADLIKLIRDQYKCSILLVEHDMRLVMDICDRICAINFGKKLAEGTPKEIQLNKEVQEAYLGKEE